MKRILLFTLLISFLGHSSASDYEYDVEGYSDEGYVYGEIEANRGDKSVEGYLYTEDGDEVFSRVSGLDMAKLKGTMITETILS